ncbi:MAG: hypothetical protein ACFFAK_10870 [Promethearchaeota archaeon]
MTSGFTITDGWMLSFIGSFMIAMYLGWLTFWYILLIGIFLLLGGVVVMYFVIRRESLWDTFWYSGKIRDYFSKYSIICISTGGLGIVIFYIVSNHYGLRMSYMNPSFFQTEILFATPFLLIAMISGIVGVSKDDTPIICLIGGLIASIWFFWSVLIFGFWGFLVILIIFCIWAFFKWLLP